MPARPRKPEPESDSPSLDDVLDDLDDDELEEYLSRRKESRSSSGSSKGDRVTILEGKHASDWLKSFGIGKDDDDDDDAKKKRSGYFDARK